MGVIYKLKDEVVDFIINQRQSNPLSSCRQLAESASQKFGLHLSKSSVHDVLKESGIVTPRGRKPKDKFKIPQEKKNQIQDSLAQVKLLPDPVESDVIASEAKVLIPDTRSSSQSYEEIAASPTAPRKDDVEISPEYEGAGRIFFKAALWDLGIFSENNIKEEDWDYYLTYTKGIKVVLENNKDFFIDLPLPLERCIRETADGLINNVRPFVAYKVSDEMLFKAFMEAQAGFKIEKMEIVDCNDHILFEYGEIVEIKRNYSFENRLFVENMSTDSIERSKAVFFSQTIDNNYVIDKIINLKGFNRVSKDENTVNLLIDGDENKDMLQEAANKLNGMYLQDDQNRLVKVKLSLG